MSELYRPKRPNKGIVWRHKFFCLAYKDQTRSPTTEADKEEFFRAGLGEKELTFNDVNMNQQDFHHLILEAFPRLKKAGGFRFLKGLLRLKHTTICIHTEVVLTSLSGCLSVQKPAKPGISFVPN